MPHSTAPLLQYTTRPGLLDLGWGHPRPALLPLRSWQRAQRVALDGYGWRALTYGHSAGPGPLLEWLADHLGGIDAVPGAPEEFFVTAGASNALWLAVTVLAEPGDVLLVDVPTYHYALRIFRDRGVRLLAAPRDEAGLDVAALEDLVCRLRGRGARVCGLYLVPTYANPTGRSLLGPRRAALVRFAREAGLAVIEDDSYRELGYEDGPPASLWALDPGGPVVRVGSFSKTVAPGLRLGFVQARAEVLQRLTALGYVDSGGGLNHTTALTMAAFGGCGAYQRHVEQVRAAYRRQREALVGALREQLPGWQVPSPAGGWFVWLALPPGLQAGAVLAAAERAGVSFLEGRHFHVDPNAGRGHIRLSFSLLSPAELVQAAARLGGAVRSSAHRRSPAGD